MLISMINVKYLKIYLHAQNLKIIQDINNTSIRHNQIKNVKNNVNITTINLIVKFNIVQKINLATI